MVVSTAKQAVTPVIKRDLDIKTRAAITRARIIEALEAVTEPLTLTPEDRRAAANMLRGDGRPRVRVSNEECAHLAVFYWRKLKKYAVGNGRHRWNADQRKLAAKESIELAALHYPTQSKRLKPADVLKLVDQPVRKSVKRKTDDVAHTDLRNKSLLEHFESINCLKGFGFDGSVSRNVKRALTASPSKSRV